jgi:S-adenosylmethionine:diacylglycerol 3-amino-3-carboxypropyl transferase
MMAFWRRPDRPEAGIEPIEMNAQRYRAIENRDGRIIAMSQAHLRPMAPTVSLGRAIPGPSGCNCA